MNRMFPVSLSEFTAITFAAAFVVVGTGALAGTIPYCQVLANIEVLANGISKSI